MNPVTSCTNCTHTFVPLWSSTVEGWGRGGQHCGVFFAGPPPAWQQRQDGTLHSIEAGGTRAAAHQSRACRRPGGGWHSASTGRLPHVLPVPGLLRRRGHRETFGSGLESGGSRVSRRLHLPASHHQCVRQAAVRCVVPLNQRPLPVGWRLQQPADERCRQAGGGEASGRTVGAWSAAGGRRHWGAGRCLRSEPQPGASAVAQAAALAPDTALKTNPAAPSLRPAWLGTPLAACSAELQEGTLRIEPGSQAAVGGDAADRAAAAFPPAAGYFTGALLSLIHTLCFVPESW